MALPWIKLHVSLVHNGTFLGLTPPARLTYFVALALAGECEQGGILAVRTGPMTPTAIRASTGLGEAQQRRVLDELTASGLLRQQLDGAYAVEKFVAKQAAMTGAERMQRLRSRDDDVTNVLRQRHGEGETSSSLRSSSGPSSVLRTSSGAPDAPKKGSDTRAAAEPPKWILPLVNAVEAIMDREMQDLSGDERVTLGRWHALHFGNCTKTEAFNQRRGVNVAAGFARMAVSDRFGGLTVRRYLKLAQKVYVANGETPFFDAWQILAFDTGYEPSTQRRVRT